MSYIFFDLETSSKDFIGQILNYSFIHVSSDWTVMEELNGNIRLSCLQLPEAGAILANKINIIEHQKTSQDNEIEALSKIFKFITKIIEGSGEKNASLIGYNSAKFDLAYLRTSFIRNGFNPYFSGRLLNKDLLFTVRKAYCSNPEFARIMRESILNRERLSLSLETVTNSLGLLHGKQIHSSREDVLLTIELAKTLAKQFYLDVRVHEAYEPTQIQAVGSIVSVCKPNYNFKEMTESPTPIKLASKVSTLALLDNNYRYALWINLERFKEILDGQATDTAIDAKQAIEWYNKSGSQFMLFNSAFFSKFSNSNEIVIDPMIEPCTIELAKTAHEKLNSVNLKNFFERSICDIEQDIYRLDFDSIALLNRLIWENKEEDFSKLKTRDAKVLYMRFQLRSADSELVENARLLAMFNKYIRYRYGGQAKLNKSQGPDRIHPTIDQLLEELTVSLEDANTEDRYLLERLREFYHGSLICSELKKDLPCL